MKRGIFRDGYFKVSRRLLRSSLWSDQPGDVVKLFLTLISLSQDPAGPRDGTVLIARRQLAGQAFLSDEAFDVALAALTAPDTASRCQDHDGRRVEVLPNGYRILNYGRYHDEAKERLLHEARSAAGETGGKKSGQVRRSQSFRPRSKNEANAKQNEATETETETEKTETDSERESLRVVFDHWRTVMGKAEKSTHLTPGRRAKILARLREPYPVEDILRAIDGNRASPWHQGENPGSKRYDDLTLICRSGADLERFRDMAPARKPPLGIPRHMTPEFHEAEQKAREAAAAARKASA